MRALVLVSLLAACRDTPASLDLARSDLQPFDAQITATDRDGDGISDADEGLFAASYLPYLSIAPLDACPTSGLVVRVTPAEQAPLVRIRYAWLFDRSCEVAVVEGAAGSISLLVDPSRSDETAIVAMRAVARPGTTCVSASSCGRCSGQSPCAMLGEPARPAVWASQDRHGVFVNRALRCTQTGACAAACADATSPRVPPMVNVGEPQVSLVHDLTSEGFISVAQGWQSASLMHYDPWGGLPFGAGASVASLLSSQDTDTPVCTP